MAFASSGPCPPAKAVAENVRAAPDSALIISVRSMDFLLGWLTGKQHRMQTLAAETPAKRRFKFCKSSKYFAAFGAYDRADARSTGKKTSVCPGAMPVDGLDAAVRKIGTSARPAGGSPITLHHVPALRKCR